MRPLIFISILFFARCTSQNTNNGNSIAQADSIYINDTITYVRPYIPFDAVDSVIARKVAIGDTIKPRNWYQFSYTRTYVNGCGGVYLQKISYDEQYELIVNLTFENLPKYEWIDIQKHPKSIHIYFKKYHKGNKYIAPICNDSRPESPEPLDKYVATEGRLNINYWSEKESVLCVMLKDIVVLDDKKNEVHLPFEFFELIKVFWWAG